MNIIKEDIIIDNMMEDVNYDESIINESIVYIDDKYMKFIVINMIDIINKSYLNGENAKAYVKLILNSMHQIKEGFKGMWSKILKMMINECKNDQLCSLFIHHYIKETNEHFTDESIQFK